MKDDRLPINLREKLWRYEPTAAEEEEFAAAAQPPASRAEWETEVALTRALRGLSNAPVSSNFTARVLQAAQREVARDARRSSWWGRLWRPYRQWAPRVAVASTVLALGVLGYFHMEQAERVRLIESVSAVSEVAAVPSPEILRDFEAIQALNRPPGPDVELLTLLQ
jgi:hypothetical protein